MPADIEKYFERMTAKLYSAALSDILDEIDCRNQVISPGLAIKPLNAYSGENFHRSGN